MSLDFVAIDFKTANSFRSSPCSVGLVNVRDGVVLDAKVALIRPPNTFGPDDFDDFNVAMHGITWDMVAESPSFPEVWEQLGLNRLEVPLVAHYAAFDLGVIRDSFTEEDIEWPNLDYTCSVVLARRVVDLPSYSLPYVADAFGVVLGEHHEAGADAIACAEIMLALAEHQRCTSLGELLSSVNVGWGS